MKNTVYILLAALAFSSCGDKKLKPEDELVKLKKERSVLDQQIDSLEAKVNRNAPVKPTAISVFTVKPQNFNAFVEVQAQVAGDENVLATPQMAGVVTSVLVRVGQRVSKGQTLAYLDAAAVDQQIKAMDAQLSLTKQLYEKQKNLWAQNIGTEVQLLQAKTQYESMLSQRAATVAQRNMYSVKSPISGVVDEVDIVPGDMASPGMKGIRIVSKDKLKAEANLGENYLGKVKAGDPVTLIFPDLNDTIKTNLTYVAQSVNPISRAFTVQVKLGNNSKLHPNMSCKMKIANYENSSAIIIPISIIQKTANGDLLYVVEGGKAKAVIVTTGKNSNGMVEVLSGVNAGDKVITAGFQDLDNGEAVSIQ